MTPGDWVGAAGVVTAFAGLVGYGWRFVTRRQDAAHSAAETRKLNAEAAGVEGNSWAAQVHQALELLEAYRREVGELKAEVGNLQELVDTLEDHVGSLERLMREAGLDVPQRPDRRS